MSTTIIAASVAGAVALWCLLVFFLVNARRQNHRIREATSLVLAHEGDLVFSTPELMRKQMTENGQRELDSLRQREKEL